MLRLLWIALFLVLQAYHVQSQMTITVIDFVQVAKNRQQEALFYYENNWKVYRDQALKKGIIKSYRLLTTMADTTADFDLILMTEYSDSAQYNLREARFNAIIKEIRPDGPVLLNEIKPNDFRQIKFGVQTETRFSSDKKKRKRRVR